MPSFDIGQYYEGGRRRFDEFIKRKRTFQSQEKEKERQWKTGQALEEHQQALQRLGITHGEGSPAMIAARTGRGTLGLETAKFGFEQQFKPWQEAMRYDLGTRKAGAKAQPSRADIGAIYKFEAADDFDASDPEWIAKANALREAAGMPLWVKGEDKKVGFGIPLLSPARTMPTYRQESEEEYRNRMTPIAPAEQTPRTPGITVNAPPTPYSTAPIPLNPQPEIRRITSGVPVPGAYGAGEGYMKMSGQPGYTELRRPGMPTKKKKSEWQQYNY